MDDVRDNNIYTNWMDAYYQYKTMILYCDRYDPSDFAFQMIHDKYGDPSPELRQYAKDQMMTAFMEFWNAL